jgi:hypothetical protein
VGEGPKLNGFLGLAVRGTGESVSDVGDILLAQPAQQVYFIIYHFCQNAKFTTFFVIVRLNQTSDHPK